MSGSTATAEPKVGSKPESKLGNKTGLTNQHKEALAEGRREGKIVRDYLNALDESKPKRGRKVSLEVLNERIEKTEAEIASADAYDRLTLTQHLMDLHEQQRQATDTMDISALEAEFVKVAASWASKKRYSYEAFRAVGVPASVLKAAGIAR